MPVSNDLLQAKAALSHRLLGATQPPGRRGEMRTVSVAAAIESAPSNIHAVGVGRKEVEGEATDQPCVRVYVVEKLAPSMVPQPLQIPTEIDGMPTDVIESPRASLAQTCSQNRRRRQRPAPAGISAGHFQITAGTIAAYCRSTREGDSDVVRVLSNNHVFANVNDASTGDPIYQPGVADGGDAGDRMAGLDRFVPINLSQFAENEVDAAISILDEGFPWDREICTIGPIAGATDGVEDQLVRKHGRTSGYTEGYIRDESVDAIVGMDHGNPNIVARFVNQLRIDATSPYPHFGLGGDSGSLVLDRESGTAVGLYFAGPPGGQYGLANPIEAVLRLLEIELL